MDLINNFNSKENLTLQELCFGEERDKQGISDRNIFSLENSKRAKNDTLSVESIKKFYKNPLESPRNILEGGETFRRKSFQKKKTMIIMKNIS